MLLSRACGDGRPRRFKNRAKPEHRVWDLLLRYQIGVLSPLPVPHDEIDEDRLREWKPGEVQLLKDVYGKILLLIGLRSAHHGQGIEGAPIAYRFGAAWCGLGTQKNKFGDLLKELMVQQRIVSVATYEAFGTMAHLLLPPPAIRG